MKVFNKDGGFLAEDKLYDGHIGPCFSDHDLQGANLAHIDVDGAEFTGANLTGADFRNAILYWASMSDTICVECDFRNTWFRGASLRHANLQRADLRGAIFDVDNLNRKTDLCGANLSGARIEGAQFPGAIYDLQTVFPDGFNPEAEGLTFNFPDTFTTRPS